MKAFDALSSMRNITASFKTELDKANNFADQSFTSQAVLDRQSELRAATVKSHEGAARKLAQSAATDAANKARDADLHVARLTVDDTRAVQEWEHNTLPRLTAGESGDTVLPDLNIEGLAAVERFGPSWERMHNPNRGPVEKLQTEGTTKALVDCLQECRWDQLTTPTAVGSVEEARSVAAVAGVTEQFAAQNLHIRQSSALTGASTFLNTVESPVLGGRFAKDLPK